MQPGTPRALPALHTEGDEATKAWLEALADWARREGLWLLSDEVYEDYVYRGEHASVGQRRGRIWKGAMSGIAVSAA